MMSRLLVVLGLALATTPIAPVGAAAPPPAPLNVTLTLPRADGSVRFAVMGDTGRGQREQLEVASQMAAVHRQFPFDFVIMLGDNIYGSDTPADMASKFEIPYKPLLDAGVVFHAALGNHDNPNQRFYPLFNMGGERYYTFRGDKGRSAAAWAAWASSPSTATTWTRSRSTGWTRSSRPPRPSGRSPSSIIRSIRRAGPMAPRSSRGPSWSPSSSSTG